MAMTVKDHSPPIPKLDPVKRYRYTWPGQPPRVVSGKELRQLCQGADAAMLEIEEVKVDDPAEPPPAPETADALPEDDGS